MYFKTLAPVKYFNDTLKATSMYISAGWITVLPKSVHHFRFGEAKSETKSEAKGLKQVKRTCKKIQHS